jgi:hypothetical protein
VRLTLPDGSVVTSEQRDLAQIMTTLPQGDLPSDSGILRTAAQHNQANVGIYAEVLAPGVIRRRDRVAVCDRQAPPTTRERRRK